MFRVYFRNRAALLDQKLGLQMGFLTCLHPYWGAVRTNTSSSSEHSDSKNPTVFIGRLACAQFGGVVRWEGRVKKRFRVKYDSNPQRRLVHTPKIVTQVRPFKLYATLHRTGMLQKLGGKGKTRGGGIEKATLANLRSEHRFCKIGADRRGYPG